MGLDRIVVKRPKALDIEELRAMRPIQNEAVQADLQEDGTMVLVAPIDSQGRGFLAVLARWMKLPATKSFELEPVGAYVWSLCDGRHTVETIAGKLRERYKMNRLEAEAALSSFLRMLGQRRLILLDTRKK